MCAAQKSAFAPQVDFSSETPNRGQQLSKKKKKKSWIRDIVETDIFFMVKTEHPGLKICCQLCRQLVAINS